MIQIQVLWINLFWKILRQKGQVKVEKNSKHVNRIRFNGICLPKFTCKPFHKAKSPSFFTIGIIDELVQLFIVRDLHKSNGFDNIPVIVDDMIEDVTKEEYLFI
jgi:hypothetical protein